MNELDEMWSQMLAQAAERAKASGHHDVADYLNLKAANDVIRQTGVKWLVDTFIEIAGETNRSNLNVSLERKEPHNFQYRGANLVGSSVTLLYGLRCLSIEAGWTRTPADGFMRGGALAFARLIHRGMVKANAEIALIRSDPSPLWRLITEDKFGDPFRSDDLNRHFVLFMGN